jgi:hypothetical protein
LVLFKTTYHLCTFSYFLNSQVFEQMRVSLPVALLLGSMVLNDNQGPAV